MHTVAIGFITREETSMNLNTEVTETFNGIRFNADNALTVLQRMLEAIRLRLPALTCACRGCEEFSVPPDEPIFELVVGFGHDLMPSVAISSKNGSKALLAFKKEGLRIEARDTALPTSRVEGLMQNCRTLINLMLDAARDYINDHFQRFLTA